MLTDHSTKTPDTRTRILEAAFSVLSRQGYENSSIKEIAEQAGVAQGLVHYYFKSKQQLVLAVLAEVCREMKYGDEQGAAGAQAAYEKFKAMLKDKRATHALYIQLIAMGLHDKELGRGVLDFIQEDRSHIENIARQVLAEREADPTPARSIASVIEAAVLGIMVQNLIDPDFNAEEAVDMLNTMSLSAIFPPTPGA
jgi:AcrR family transcriptional regulator